jgi:uncharacterized protein YwgA
MKEIKLSKPYDEAIFAYAILSRIGCGKVDTFEQRLRSQKVQYFAQLFKVSTPYTYGLYLRGPYSSELAHDLYAIRDAKISADISEFVPNELEERLEELKKFISKTNTRGLEIASTLHWLINVAKISKEKTHKKLKEWKGADDQELESATKLISSL